MNRIVLLLFIIMALLGIAIAGWAGFGDSSVIAGAGGVHQALLAHGQAENAALRKDLYDVVLRLQWPWAIAQWLGYGVIVTSVIGVVAACRSRQA
jgi:hypothetical protein